MSTRWIHTSLGVMLAGTAVLWASGCSTKTGPQSASGAGPAPTSMVFDDELDLPTASEAEEMANAQINAENADVEFERLVSEIDGVYFGR